MARPKVFITDFEFTKLFNLVESGYSIDEACIKLNSNRNKFYRNATDEQKRILKTLKLTQRKAFSLSLKSEQF
jgi:Ser/Thr protein kinase RdoA (MazF antagonist)